MIPTCYLLQIADDGKYSLYLGEITTAACLKAFNAVAPVRLREIYALNEKGNPIPDDTIPAVAPVSDWRHILERDGLNLVDFTADIDDAVLSTHDDGEGHFSFPDQGSAMNALRLLIGQSLADDLFPILLANRGRYVAREAGAVEIFNSFEDYLSRERVNSGHREA